MQNIEYIELEKILPHPKNPRRDLGDLEELTESIRENGVLQNLTLVPADQGRYYCVIGHRRTEASKRAGLKTVPCVIKEMDEKTQVQTMLMENIQRSDLTPYEQAQGFQMMMDLGSSVTDIVKETGFSESTVRHRLKLTELDPELLQEKTEQNVNMFDLIKLEQVKDPDDKKTALEAIGTNNFNYTLKNILEKQERLEAVDRIRKKLELYATEITQEENRGNDFEHITSWSLYVAPAAVAETIEDIDIEKEYGLEKLYFLVAKYSVSLYKSRTKNKEDEEQSEEQKEWEAQQKEQDERIAKLRGIGNTMYMLRFDFAKYLSIKKAKEHLMTILKFCGMILALENTSWSASTHLEKLIDFEEQEGDEYANSEAWETVIKKRLAQYPETTLFQIVYANLEVGTAPFCFDGTYQDAERLEELYKFLTLCGYEMSDEEKQIMDGTHELYTNKPGR